ncbi:TPR repeat-containing protein [Cryptosporidium andersoni]|uniref:TPR repeat-containing protein n=1 Tax=Cryptosporidium andersoni TaxID=117008 RepID=A0A1J4MNP6_9CRYT|nr:TPR repeat-containing protein [Cryptosporidium andersoni]
MVNYEANDNEYDELFLIWEYRLASQYPSKYNIPINENPKEIFERLKEASRIAELCSLSELLNSRSLEYLVTPLIRSNYPNFKDMSFDEIGKSIISYYNNYINNNNNNLEKKVCQFEVLCIVILLLKIYLQSNWTGPPNTINSKITQEWKLKSENKIDDIGNILIFGPQDYNSDNLETKFTKRCIEFLEIDGEYIYQRCAATPYLAFSIILIEILSEDSNNNLDCNSLLIEFINNNNNNNNISYLTLIPLWRQRIYRIWQRSLEGGAKNTACPYLEEIILTNYSSWLFKHFNIVLKDFNINDRFKNDLLRNLKFDLIDKDICIGIPHNIIKEDIIYYLLDLSISLAMYGRANPCAIILQLIAKIEGFTYNFTGALGRRRISQLESTSHLVVEINRRNRRILNLNETVVQMNDSNLDNNNDLPVNILLDSVNEDNDLYETVKLDEKEVEGLCNSLNLEEQCVLLCHGVSLYETSPSNDVMAYEQLEALMNRIIQLDVSKIENKLIKSQVHNWLCYSTALWYRCYSEHHRGRTADRACLQLQSLVDQFKDEEPDVLERLRFIFSVNYPNIWEAKKELGIRMMRIGSVLSAYNMFVDMCLWEDAVDCLVVANRKEEAIDLIKKQLLIRPTPRLYCSLGDLTNDLTQYEEAWKISGNKYARAQRSLGNNYFKSGQLNKALDAYKKASIINSTNVNCWFSMGCVALKLDKWDDALKAFSRVVTLDPQQGEAWANLAAGLSKKELWNEAQNAINEGLKYSRENWMMWDSSLKIAIQRNDLNTILECLLSMLKLSSNISKYPIWSLPIIIDLLKRTQLNNTKELSYSLLDKAYNLLNQISQVLSKPVVFYALCEIQIIKQDFISAYSSKFKELRGTIDVIFNNKINMVNKEKYIRDIPNIIHELKNIINKCTDGRSNFNKRTDELEMAINTILKRLEIEYPNWTAFLHDEISTI